MGDMMSFPNTIDEFLDDYSFKDKEEVYTNGSILIPVFRVKQGIEHYMRELNGVIVLPVKIGQGVYYILDGFIEPCTIEIVFLGNYTDKDGNCSYMAEIHFDREDCPYVTTEIYFTDIGKTVFLTKSEAEKALLKGV